MRGGRSAYAKGREREKRTRKREQHISEYKE